MNLRRTGQINAAVFFLLLGICLFPALLGGAEARWQTIFAPQARYSVEITTVDGNDYVNLFEVLEPLRKVDAHADGKNWKLTVAATPPVELRFRDKKRKFTLGGGALELPADFRLIGDKGYVPVASVDWLLTQITGQTSEMHSATHRLFLGGVAARINAELRKSPSRLVLTFPFAVNPEIVTEGNTLRLTFAREPVVSSGTDNLTFNDSVIASATFSETTRGAEFAVKGNGPLTLSLADNGRTVIITGPQAPAPAPTVAQSPSPAEAQTTAAQKPAAPAAQGPKPFVVAVDAAHGGGDTGAIFSDRLLEKDVTLAIARRLVHELQSRGVPAMLVRNSDTQIVPDQRAVIANTAAASRVYIAIHASASGSGVKIYREMIAPAKVAERSAFVPWQTAQAGWLDRSAELAKAIAEEFERRQFASRSTSVPLPTLNNIAGPAVAVEVAPPAGKNPDIASADYQQAIAAVLANAIAAVQPPQKPGGAQ